MDDEWPEEDVKPKKGKKKGGKKANVDEDVDMDGTATPEAPAAPEVANIDDEWPEEDVKPKKGKKKGGKKSQQMDAGDDDMDVATPAVEDALVAAATPAAEEAAPSPAAPGTPAEPADGEEEGGVKILSKKEKERLKKEKEKVCRLRLNGDT